MKLASLAALTGGVLVAAGLAFAPTAALAAPSAATLYASPSGSGTACSSSAPCSIDQAKATVRTLEQGATGDVTVLLAGGTYRLSSPLSFDAGDGGRDGTMVTWRAQGNGTPIFSGSTAVTGWSVYDATKNIYVANTPTNVDTRQLYVNGDLAPRAAIHLDKTDISYTATGFTINNAALNNLASLPQQNRIELQGTSSFTDRYARVSSISGTTVTMAQPGWDNNTWGWDTIQSPFEEPTITLENSLDFVRTAGQWYIDPTAGKLYYKPADGVDPSKLNVELPRLQSLVNVGGTYDAPVRNLTIQGLQFSGTSWLGPSSSEGYASQQGGTYISGSYSYRPSDAFSSCKAGCEAYERTRPTFKQIPAAVQVSAASQISLLKNTFTNIGSTGLGIGMDANAHASGVGLGAANVSVVGNVFTASSASAITVGGVQTDAHHPSDQRMVNHDILIQNNTISGVARDYKETPGVLSTYVTSARIVQNEVAHLPYDGIDTGYGWGINDPGGSSAYEQRGYYKYNPKFSTKTTLANNVVANNLVHDTKKVMVDGGAIYNLSASPNSVWKNNYLYDMNGRLGLYLDEGSRYMRLQSNVVADASQWVFANTGAPNTTDNIADDNYHNSGGAYGDWNSRGRVTNDHSVTGTDWPAAAKTIICEAGVAPRLRTSLNANYSSNGYASCGATGSQVSSPYLTTAPSTTSSSFSQDGDQFALSAASADVWGFGGQRDDGYGAIYQAGAVVDGTTVTVRVDAQNETHEWAKTGLMIRNDITKAGASAGYAVVAVTPAHGVLFNWDSNGDGYLDKDASAAIDTQRPIWLRLVRSGSDVSALYSLDGTTFIQVGSAATLPGIAATQDGGVFSTSHDTSRSTTNRFSDLQIVSGMSGSLTAFATGNARISQSGSTVTIGANGRDVNKNGPQFDDAYGSAYLPGAFVAGTSLTAQVTNQTEPNAWAKMGLMVRSSIAKPGVAAGYAVLAVTPSNGVLFSRDTDGDGYIDTDSQASIATNRPIWLKLSRSGDQVSAYYSTDGTTYSQVGSAVTLPGITAKLDAGVFSTSHDASPFKLNTITAPKVTSDAPPAANVAVLTSSRCVSGKVALVVQVDNKEAGAVDVTIDTPYGSKTLTGLAGGKTSSNVFNTRTASMAAGSVKTTANFAGKTDASAKEQPYDAKSCS